MPGVCVLCQAAFTDADSFIRELASKLVGIVLASDEPVEMSAGTMVFEALPAAECDTVTFRHWGGREFPVVFRGEDINSRPKARLVIELDYRIFEIEEELLSTIARVLGVESLEQAYTEL